MKPALRKLLKWPLRAVLRSRSISPKVAFELRRDHYADLQITIPLSHGMACPVRREDYLHSFTEIFLTAEYGDFLKHIPLPRRWLDLGCHAGYFSTFLAWQWRKLGSDSFRALLSDADPRVAQDVEYLINLNKLQAQFTFLPGLIASGSGTMEFALRDGMGSSTDLRTAADSVAAVPILSQETMLAKLAPPIDLLKLDIEGAEFALIEHYPQVLAAARALVVEWHSWDSTGTAEARLTDELAKRGFEFTAVLQPRKHHLIEGKPLSTGCHLYKNLEPAARAAQVI